MASLSSSSSRTLDDAEVNRRGLDDGDEESLVNLNDLEIPDLSLCNSFDFMNEEEVLPDVSKIPFDSPPLSPETLARRENLVRESFTLGRLEFPEGCNLDYISYYANRSVDLKKLGSWVDFNNGYHHQVPQVEDRVWMMLEFGMQGIPLIMFYYGLRLPMSPFHLARYEAIGCGIAQLVPNAVAQISGFIELCDEKERIPSIRLFFSIYGIRYKNGQVYFDTRNKRSKIVSVRSFVRPCRKVFKATIDYLNNLEKYETDYLDSFQGSRPVFTHLDLKILSS